MRANPNRPARKSLFKRVLPYAVGGAIALSAAGLKTNQFLENQAEMGRHITGVLGIKPIEGKTFHGFYYDASMEMRKRLPAEKHGMIDDYLRAVDGLARQLDIDPRRVVNTLNEHDATDTTIRAYEQKIEALKLAYAQALEGQNTVRYSLESNQAVVARYRRIQEILKFFQTPKNRELLKFAREVERKTGVPKLATDQDAKWKSYKGTEKTPQYIREDIKHMTGGN